MAVYVDNWEADFRNMKMSHLMADTREELFAMADKIGVQRKWIQAPDTWREHFDVCLTKRRLAVKHGAIEMSPKDLVRRMIELKGTDFDKNFITRQSK